MIKCRRTELPCTFAACQTARTEPKWTLVCKGAVLVRLVSHYHYLNSIINELWQNYNRLFKRCASCQPYLYHFAWQSVPSLIFCSSNGKNSFLGRSPGQTLQADTAAGFSTDTERQVPSQAFPYIDRHTKSLDSKFNSEGFHQESRSLFHNMPAKPSRLESSSIDFFLFFFPHN